MRGGERMNELVKIGEHEISAKMYMGQRVVTFKDIDMEQRERDLLIIRNTLFWVYITSSCTRKTLKTLKCPKNGH